MEEREQPKFCKMKILHLMAVVGIIQVVLQTFSIYFYPTIIWKIIALGLTLGMLLVGCFLFNNLHLSHLHLYVLFSVFYSMYLIIIMLFAFLNNYNEVICLSTTSSPLSTTTTSTTIKTTTTTTTTTITPCTQITIPLFFIIISIINMFLSFIQLRCCSALRLFLKNNTQPPRARRQFPNRNFPPRYSQCSTSNQPLPSLGKPPSYSFSIEALDVTTLEDSPNLQSNDLPPTYENVVLNEQPNNLNEN